MKSEFESACQFLGLRWHNLRWNDSLFMIVLVWAVGGLNTSPLRAADPVDFQSQIQPIFTRYCAGCHGKGGGEADVSLVSFESISSGYPKGKLYLPGNPEESKIYQLMMGQSPKMPPEDELEPTKDEIELVRKWIAQGAMGDGKKVSLIEQYAAPMHSFKREGGMPLFAIASLDEETDVVGLQGALALKQANGRLDRSTLVPLAGKAVQIRPSHDRTRIVVSAGVPSVGGLVMIALRVDGKLLIEQTIEGHADVVNSAVLSPDSTILATAGHDKVIHLWDRETGVLIRTLKGHNGAIYDLAFDPSGRLLASASADETIKIWSVTSGERLDTFGEGEGEQYVVRFNKIGDQVIAAGADKRIRCWEIPLNSPLDANSVNPMIHSVFAHEGSVLAFETSRDGGYLVTVGEDKTVKLWNTSGLIPLGVLGQTSDIPTGVDWSDSQTVAVSSMDGEVFRFSVDKLVPGKLPVGELEGNSKSPHDVPGMIPIANELEKQPLLLQEEGENRNRKSAQRIPTNSILSGVLRESDTANDEPGDWYSFEAKQGETWVITVDAAASGSKLDSLLDVLDQTGEPIIRTRLQAIRESYFTFRGKDSTIADDFRLHRWEDMELNDYLYASGEVVKLWMYPRGPDSGFRVYPGRDKRFTYFDTTATTHALNEPAWIVTELEPDQAPIPNGLPVFPIYYTNDDAADRKIGTDSQVRFTAPQDGVFIVRLRDARGQSGDDYHYKLSVLPPRPRFTVRAEQSEITLRSGAGTEFSVVAERWDGLDQEIRFDISGLPEGLLLTKDFSVPSEQIFARGTLYMPTDFVGEVPSEFKMRFTPKSASGTGDSVAAQPFEIKVKKGEPTKLKLHVTEIGQTTQADNTSEVVIKAGTTTRVQLTIDREGIAGDIAFGNEESGRNLPHGVFVDNIGLNGLLIPAGESSREVFITAAAWVPEQTRYFHLKAEGHENPTSAPMRIRVIR